MGRKTPTCLRRVRCEWNELYNRNCRAPRNPHGTSEHSGEVSEWFKEHAWRACNPKGFGGSNPPLSVAFSMRDSKDTFYLIGLLPRNFYFQKISKFSFLT